MRVGRPPQRSSNVDALEGGELEKERLRAMLETLAGERTVEEACSSVGLARSRFYELRERALQGALDSLAPGIPGRPPKRIEVDPRDVEDLRRMNGWLREELELSRARTEIAMVMPEILREPVSEPPPMRGKGSARARRAGKRSGARKRGTKRGSRR